MVRRALLLALALLAAGCLEGGGDDGDGGAGVAPATQACTQDLPVPEDMDAWKAERPRVLLDTSRGDVTIALDVERAPLTAGNFLDLVRDGFYDGTLFHRVISGFVIQGGDPLSKDSDPSNDGTGGPGYDIPDEFNPSLRHDGAGVLSMANSGPDTGGSQFFVTLAATPHLDDRHSVFGEVVEGIEVVEAIGQERTDAADRPTQSIVLRDAEALEPETYEAEHGVGVHPVLREKRTEPGRAATFAVILKNEGNVRDAVALHATAPEGWTCSVDARPVVPAGTARVVFLTVTPPEGAEGAGDVRLAARSAWPGVEEATSNVTVRLGGLGEPVREGERVVANYAGLLPDGRLFDTSFESVATAEGQPKFETQGGYRHRGSWDTFSFTVGSGVIPGFTNLAKTARVGETVTGLIPPQDAYATGNVYERPLTGRALVFELEIVSKS